MVRVFLYSYNVYNMTPIATTLSFADQKATLDAIFEELKTKSPSDSILVKIKSTDSYDEILKAIQGILGEISSEIQSAVSANVFTVLDILWYIRHGIYNYVVFDTTITEELTQKQIEEYYEIQNSINEVIKVRINKYEQNHNTGKNVSLNAEESTQIPSSIYQIYFDKTSFEDNNTSSINFKINKNILITDVIVTSTTSGNHYHLPQKEINKLATVFAYLPADNAGFKTIQITPSLYDNQSGMYGQVKAVTVTYIVPRFSSLASLH